MIVQTIGSKVNMLMEDEFGIVYLIENAQQFWSELEDILRIPGGNTATLSMLDASLRRFISLCASYHEQFLQSPLQLEHACELLLDSDLFTFHSERMCELLVDDVQSNTDPHFQLITFTVLLYFGRRKSSFLRSQKRWQPLVPLLMDHVLVDIDSDIEDVYLGTGSVSGGGSSRSSMLVTPIAIEAKLRSLGVRLLYEVCRVQKLSVQDLSIFSDSFIDTMFELVEKTRYMHDETFNYSVIKLLVALNEQFMVASLTTGGPTPVPQTPISTARPAEAHNRVLNVLISRLGSSKTFGENMIFMLNRANRTAEDLCMQLLVLKLLYLLFTTKGTSEYFYTNDLCVLVDVFLRELVDLDEESESLRHTYLRVLHPLLTKTQLRDIPYKRPQIVMALESVIQNADIRDINPTTKRLVERCLSGDWCVQLRKDVRGKEFQNVQGDFRKESPSHDVVAFTTQDGLSQKPIAPPLHSGHPKVYVYTPKPKTMKPSKSAENLKNAPSQRSPPRSVNENMRRPSTDSAASLGGIASATATAVKRRDKVSSADDGTYANRQIGAAHFHSRSPPSPSALSLPATSPTFPPKAHRRAPPPAPPKRRKPPAVPVGTTNGGATITAIASSSSVAILNPVGKVGKSHT
ncbi:hypothetical protein SERLA73DRAFT_105792 [Serpula lacrymans var. lacrymans S7.3]|uniref:SPIN90/Ldb17 leucine-rich domain-containing protein n=2 Tax=Serpula lacrymans var. lacrymans TaxID=341189 RepID=F8PRV0_SERL3|nr:uncharacterized protein SERLADRAFT_447952 [Serpula lacrymans var. lacrymans S7.9]EGO01185.1 hypothetical protein SERLA73DRAFT_105792 [Serpula lacrymans var. lacrymans S7.3]EGO26833.1 hypothetical protein SERLADRAFT_447952 [Serpula lacrymans var. lacrymans S7.9]